MREWEVPQISETVPRMLKKSCPLFHSLVKYVEQRFSIAKLCVYVYRKQVQPQYDKACFPERARCCPPAFDKLWILRGAHAIHEIYFGGKKRSTVSFGCDLMGPCERDVSLSSEGYDFLPISSPYIISHCVVWKQKHEIWQSVIGGSQDRYVSRSLALPPLYSEISFRINRFKNFTKRAGH